VKITKNTNFITTLPSDNIINMISYILDSEKMVKPFIFNLEYMVEKLPIGIYTKVLD
jgi:hypothetical protein